VAGNPAIHAWLLDVFGPADSSIQRHRGHGEEQ
jgi:hypothetical protein